MSSLNHARTIALVWISTALLCAGCAAGPVDRSEDGQATPGEEATGAVEQPFINYVWGRNDPPPGWHWVSIYSFYYGRWVWGYGYSDGSGRMGWMVAYSNVPYGPGNPATGINPSAPRVSGSPPAQPPPGAPTAPPSLGGAPTKPPRGA